MRQQTINLYQFEELDQNTKEKVLESFRRKDYWLDLDWWNEDTTNYLQDQKGWKDVKLQYSLGYCQGDGLCFSGELDLKYFLMNIYSKKLTYSKIDAICEYIYKVFSTGNTGHYCYAHAKDIDFDYNYQDDRVFKRLDNLWQNILEEIKQYYLELCKQLEDEGYKEIDYQLSDEYIKEYIECNEYEFTEDGEIFSS